MELTINGLTSKRLDRILYNDEWSEVFPIVIARHLPRTSSDNNIMLLNYSKGDEPAIKYFKLLNF